MGEEGGLAGRENSSEQHNIFFVGSLFSLNLQPVLLKGMSSRPMKC